VRTWTCADQKCRKANVPYRYTEDYEGFPAVPVCVVGNTGHGKSAYLAGTFKQLDTISNFNVWPGFLTDALDDVHYLAMRQRLARYESGEAEEGTTFQDIPEPVIVRCENIPRVGGCQLIFLDNAGEAFDDTSVKTMKSGPYLANVSTVVWLVSLTDGSGPDGRTTPHELIKTITSYRTAISNLGSTTKRQTVILTLTKGERFKTWPGFPESAKKILSDDLTDRESDPWAKLEIVHRDLHAWLLTTQYAGLLNQFIAGFKQVRVCIVSAQGREFDGIEQRSFEPKAILGPLFWLWRIERPGVWVEDGAKREFFLSLAEALRKEWAAGTVVRIQEGIHHLPAPVDLKRPITILGEGANRSATILRGRGGDYVFGIATAGTVAFENFTVERSADVGDVVRVMGGTFTAQSVAFRQGIASAEPDARSPIGNGLAAGKNSEIRLKACLFQGNGRAGLWGFGTAKLDLADCALQGNKHGLMLTAACTALAKRTAFESNRHHGILIHDKCRIEVAEGRSSANGKDGLRAIGTARVVLTGVVYKGNTGRGLELRDFAEAKIQDGQFSGNADGVVLIGDARAEMLRIEAQENAAGGVLAGERSGGTIANSNLASNATYGLHLSGDTTLEASACETRGNGKAGCLVDAGVHRRVRVAGCGTVSDLRRSRFGL